MKFGKARLIFSIFGLTAALAFAAFTVYAWFITSESVRGNGLDSVVTPGDVISFEIDYYYASSEDGKTFAIGKKIEPAGEDEEDTGELKMPNYSPRMSDNGATRSAVLLDMKLKFSVSGEFAVTARTTHSDVYSSVFADYTEKNYLSNVIFLRKAKKRNEGDTTVQIDEDTGATQYSFFKSDFDGENDKDKKDSSLSLPSYTVEDGKTGEENVHHIYYIIDYKTSQINALYSILLSKFSDHATLNTLIKYRQDITFGIEKISKD